MLLPDPVILVPGITGTYLYDQYPVSPENVWGEKSAFGVTLGTRKNYERIWLHPSGLRYEAQEPSRIVPGQLFQAAYEEFIEELRAELSDVANASVPVFPFVYDWRAPLERTQALLGGFIDEVLKRTMLIPHYHGRYSPHKSPRDGAPTLRVSLVGHSMGGLIIAGYLARKGKSHRVGRVVTVATPFRGSCDAVDKMVTGKTRPRERTAARATPTTYYLLPSYPGALTVGEWNAPDNKPTSIFDPNAWQPSVMSSIAKYVRQYAADQNIRSSERKAHQHALKVFRRMLSAAARHRDSIEQLSLTRIGVPTHKWLCIVGVDERTRMSVEIQRTDRVTEMVLHDRQVQNQWKKRTDRHLTGDGTVPFVSAVPSFLKRSNIVCVRAKYDGVLERCYDWFSGAHAMLLNTTVVQRWSAQHLRDEEIPHRWDWGVPAPGISNEAWTPPGRTTGTVDS